MSGNKLYFEYSYEKCNMLMDLGQSKDLPSLAPQGVSNVLSNLCGKNSKEGGLGLGTALLLGAGAATVGFLAKDLWNSFQEFQAQSSSSSSNDPRPPRPPNSQSDWEHKTDKKLGARKKQREAFREQHVVPDEMRCVICLDNPREVCLVPCGHVCLCEDCAEKIEIKCPVCQQRIENKKAIYI